MAYVTINEDYLHNIGDAIRTKGQTTTYYKPRDMASAISGLNLTITYIGDTAWIPKGTTTIESFYLAQNMDVCCVFIPKSVTRIEDHAFDCCSNLSTVIFEDMDNGLSVGSQAFGGCPLKNIIYLSEQMDIAAFNTCPWGSSIPTAQLQIVSYGEEV